jgi:phenylalanyl-tRNA synthetase beta chain
LELGLLNLSLLDAFRIPCPVFSAELHLLPAVFQRKGKIPAYSPFSSFPCATRDLAITADRGLAAAHIQRHVEKCIHHCLPRDVQLEDVHIFDSYEGERIAPRLRSLAFRFNLQCATRTLSEDECTAIFNRILERVESDGEFSVRRA